MKRDNVVFLFSGVFFGVMVGWILGSQQAKPGVPMAAPQAAAQPAAGDMGAAPAPPPLDETKAANLKKIAEADTKNPTVRVELGNLYFDSERYDLAIPWYEQAVKLLPNDPNVSTDLGVAYLYSNKTDQAIAQFEQSVKVDPKHIKTWLNMGIAKAMVKGDIPGGEAAWQKVIEIAPGSEEAKRAQQGIDALKGGGHGGATTGTGGGTGGDR